MKEKATTHQGGYYGIMPQHLSLFPTRLIDPSDPTDRDLHARLVALVEHQMELYSLKGQGQSTQGELEEIEKLITATDREIDGVVCDLYGLTQEERQRVEESCG